MSGVIEGVTTCLYLFLPAKPHDAVLQIGGARLSVVCEFVWSHLTLPYLQPCRVVLENNLMICSIDSE